MTTHFAFKLTDATQSGIDELLRNLDAGSPEPQHALHTRLSVVLTDEVIANAFENLIERFQGGEGAGVLHTLIGLLKGTVHVLIRQLLGKHDNAEVAKMAQYMRDRRLSLHGETRFGFALPDALGSQLQRLFGEIRAGNGVAVRAELTATMTRFADLGVERFYDDFVVDMELGFIKRKAVELGRSTISKGVHSALNKLIPSLGQKELEVFVDYYGAMFVDA
ncbi:MAG: hypothetical protein Q8J78_03265 [Moraxellaceae bacterium]|nr:hypothetical protein [Moraxellaceae bacterium]